MADPRCGCEEQMTFSIIISDVTGLFSRPEKERTIHLPCQKVILPCTTYLLFQMCSFDFYNYNNHRLTIFAFSRNLENNAIVDLPEQVFSNLSKLQKL